ncbi:GGDEF domain-containing protein [Paenibacillus sp. FSL K6-2524]|uniref:GGDEF domain-containing protein n=1 Tax=Paenibacillus sp. FSL K6-2524 TaxID=2954516 RepID=UPI0030FACA63
MISQIGEIAEVIPYVSQDTKCEQVNQVFKDNPHLQGVVVIHNDYPVALVMRVQFYQQMGTLYGYNIYMGRPIGLIMKQEPLVVDYGESVAEVSKLAMDRPEEELYDYVIVAKNSQFYGVVSIRKLLLSFAEIQTKIATFLNPLIGLPGNLSIKEKLKQILEWEHFCVLYIDLDNFKVYNDTYGFTAGDKLTQATATILKGFIYQPDSFVGHIGGDDFIAILNHHDYRQLNQSIIEQFDDMIGSFYSDSHLRQHYVLAENRAGRIEEIPLVGISIAIVTNEWRRYDHEDEIVNESTRIKKRCKADKHSCYYTNDCVPDVLVPLA